MWKSVELGLLKSLNRKQPKTVFCKHSGRIGVWLNMVSGCSMSGTVSVNITQGVLRGMKATSKSGIEYFSFKGIPYAKPPLGVLRFKAPQLPEPWSGVRDAFQEGQICAQKDVILQSFRGSEDCLFLNVYTPKNPNKDGPLKPVMVWFHGGGFVGGSGNAEIYGPDYLLAEDIVVVTFNYRLGPFGFLSLGNDKVPGNAGLKDQVMALRWIKQNIDKFGGDPGNVTIFGESAGGSSVHYHLLSPMSKGLFHRAISQSGTALHWWALTNSARERAFRLGQVLGYNTSNSDELLNFLQEVSAEKIVDAIIKSASVEEKRQMVAFLYVPTVEPGTGTEEVFLPAHPLDLITAGMFQHVPHIMGVNSLEGLILLQGINKRKLQSIDNDLQCLIPIDAPVQLDTDYSLNIGKKMREFYLGKEVLSEETKPLYAKLVSDTWFSYANYKSVKTLSAVSSAPIYSYKLSFDGSLGLFKQLLGLQDFKGVCHADDIGYLFHVGMLDIDLDKNSPEFKVLSRMVKLWTNFAKTGNPTPEITKLLDVKWEPVEKNKSNYLNIDSHLTMVEDFDQEHMSFWDGIYKSTVKTKAKL